MEEVQQLKNTISMLNAELYRVRTTQATAAVELEKIKSLLGFQRDDPYVSAYDIVRKVWYLSQKI